MPTSQKGFALVLIVLILTVVGIGALFFLKNSIGPGGRLSQPIRQPAGNWKIEEGNSDFIRGAHMGVYGDFNQNLSQTLDSAYFEYARDLNANWVGISIALYVDDSLDSTVERVYSGVDIPTYKDEDLKSLIKRLKDHGFHVYLTLALEDSGKSRVHPYHRSQIGAPNEGRSDWPWNGGYPKHQTFVAEFWESYTENAVHFAKIAQDEGVEMYSLGTETEGLFRTRDITGEKGGYIDEISSMLRQVRQVFKGKVTYDMHSAVVEEKLEHHQLLKMLWEDLNFDVIGISAYFSVLQDLPDSITPVSQFEKGWERLFENYLMPLAQKHPDRPLVFLEYFNKTSLYAGYEGTRLDEVHEQNNLNERDLVDKNRNSIDDAQEQQANMHQALFNTIEKYDGVLDGIFLWGEDYWEADWGGANSYWDEEGARGKPAEEIIRGEFGKIRAR